jgi:hypothetical protein
MKSGGKRWKCTEPECGKEILKVTHDQSIKKFNDSLGFDRDKAEAHALKCTKGKRLLVTSAQNNSEAAVKCWKTLKNIAKHYKCNIAVMSSHYRNRDETKLDPDMVKEFDPLLEDYMVAGDFQFNNVMLRADARIRPTTLNPLSGKQAHGGPLWQIFGHPQTSLEPVATNGTFPKKMYTTGSITLPNYEKGDAGAKAEFHHTMSCLILEKYNDHFTFVRQISFDENGHAYDLDLKFTSRTVTPGQRAEAITPGDEHVKWNICEKPIYGKRGLVDLLKPRYIVSHDILDGYAGSHHHLRDPMIQFQKHHSGDNDYRKELEECVDFLNRTTPEDSIRVIVPSNHHDHLKQFLDKADVNKDHTNALLICELQAAMREKALKGEDYDPFKLYVEPKLTCRYKFLNRNEPFFIGPPECQVDHSQHGDVGSNGSRGSARNLEKNPHRVTIGHSHSARIFRGVYQTGTSTGRLEYERGISDHSTSLVVQYWGGKRAVIDIYDGKYRL